NMTTGEGGMIVTDDDELVDKMRLLSLHGMSKDAWKRYTSAGSWYYEVVDAGYKYNMTDIQ
ncbi:MAG: UDP-4-amino-4,6-dideoxy-N-acetyl-beta-L-altrosamine transaminase, partial [Aliifodinibius sp.]|nr:DegT/DnrJ/EryC1/StrS aminotransferase family protein [Fodinibius sp.]NIV11240.1 UDP-4-amino-4,6-dideoxy-N-acetyl-beta-L-altrosamine transaminase [Fodinibius sp.]NIY25170.1 UDP-4-amino-4,6-dideoxy-N-acetyl-beta-L-altrosamine transaminase [Fodinibius sp.]